MTAMRKRALIAACLMVITMAVADALIPRNKVADTRPKIGLAQSFPISFGDWIEDRSVPVILPAPDVQANLDKVYNQVLARTYTNKAGYRVMLSVAYGGDQSDGMSVHRPEVCYPAQGFEVRSLRSEELIIGARRIPVTRAITVLGARTEPLTYWIINGDEAVGRGFDARIVQLKYTLRGMIPDGMLVRVSSIDRDTKLAFTIQDQFTLDMVAALEPAFRSRIVGLK